jgi:hypothetical protein
MTHRIDLLLLASLFGAGFASAASITYTDSAIGSGTLGGTAFTNSLITMTFTGDTSNVSSPMAGIFENTVGTLMLNIASLGSATFTDATQAVSNQTGTLAGFGDNTSGDFIMGTHDPTFATYGLTTSIGPITNSSVIDAGDPYETSQGELIFTSVGNATFTATLTSTSAPEPGSLVLVALGLGGVTAYVQRRRLAVL